MERVPREFILAQVLRVEATCLLPAVSSCLSSLCKQGDPSIRKITGTHCPCARRTQVLGVEAVCETFNQHFTDSLCKLRGPAATSHVLNETNLQCTRRLALHCACTNNCPSPGCRGNVRETSGQYLTDTVCAREETRLHPLSSPLNASIKKSGEDCPCTKSKAVRPRAVIASSLAPSEISTAAAS